MKGYLFCFLLVQEHRCTAYLNVFCCNISRLQGSEMGLSFHSTSMPRNAEEYHFNTSNYNSWTGWTYFPFATVLKVLKNMKRIRNSLSSVVATPQSSNTLRYTNNTWTISFTMEAARKSEFKWSHCRSISLALLNTQFISFVSGHVCFIRHTTHEWSHSSSTTTCVKKLLSNPSFHSHLLCLRSS